MALLSNVTDAIKELVEKMNERSDDIGESIAQKAAEQKAQASAQTANGNTLSEDTTSLLNDFATKYRDYLGNTRDMSLQALEQSRRNAQQAIMGSANTYGMMYSNFPARAKYQYDTNTYRPERDKVQETYQTGLNKLRSNIVNLYNTLADYDDEIASLSKQHTSNGSSKGTTLNDAGDYRTYDLVKGTWFYNSNGDPVRFGTTISRGGTPTTDTILTAAGNILDPDAQDALASAYKKALSHGYGNIVVNAGESFSPNNLNFLSESERAFMDSLGLTFAQ